MNKEFHGFIVGVSDGLTDGERERISEAIFHIKGVANIGSIGKPFEYHALMQKCGTEVRKLVWDALEAPSDELSGPAARQNPSTREAKPPTEI